MVESLHIVPVGVLPRIPPAPKTRKPSSDPVVHFLIQLNFASPNATQLRARDMAYFFADERMRERMCGRQQPASNSSEDRAKWFREQLKRGNLESFLQ